jgi:hypothetical protein
MATELALVYNTEEQALAVASLLRLNNSLINEFLNNSNIKKGNNKAELRIRITDALEADVISYADIYTYLNPIESWGRQHVVLYEGPAKDLDQWRNPTWVANHIEEQGLTGLLNKDLPLALPKELTLSSIKYSNSTLRITAVERREGEVRDPEFDYETESMAHALQSDSIAVEIAGTATSIDETIIYRAYRYQVYRGIIAFEWDLMANHATLQISQLPSGEKYEDATARFEVLISNLLNLSDHSAICLRSVITRLHEMEEAKKPEARSKGIAYKTVQGRTIEGKSAGGSLGLLGELVVDTTMSSVRKVSVGHTGNFYWLPPDVNLIASENPLTNEIHVFLNGDARRCNFPVFSPEPQIRYVLQRIRAIAAGTP